MAFCTHCGAQLPAGAKFCTSCGKSVVTAGPQGIVIDAPPGTTVTISDPVPGGGSSVKASPASGESVLASWSAPKAQKPDAPARTAPAPPAPAPQKPVAANGPQTVRQALEKTRDDLVPKKSKVKWWVWVLIAIGTYLLLQLFPVN